ncbi:WD repeat and FYVE domain-containing protein 3 [Toxocara canis]|uniref:WD repeat and FYVE domain-containing protein 3 n=1 Tax=Toxocara canis TaxID=6265 RepID=A0A0B2VIK6_TOXCA|nr:WD repeat and FYVE domain-containing protein 3 [Toxocara canis]
MARSILRVGRNVFKTEKHLLLAPFYYVLERLSSHAITPTDLRHFLRLDLPLCCRNLEETEGEEPICEGEGGPVPIGRYFLPLLSSGSGERAKFRLWKAAAQLYTALVVKALLRPERNQQIMCQANMARSILRVGRNVFKTEKHLLLAPFYYVLERLSSHAITPTDLRHFLRLDLPLCCRNLEETEGEEPICEGEGGPVPIGRYFLPLLSSGSGERAKFRLVDDRLSHAVVI